jgi:hypothetical protein
VNRYRIPARNLRAYPSIVRTGSPSIDTRAFPIRRPSIVNRVTDPPWKPKVIDADARRSHR